MAKRLTGTGCKLALIGLDEEALAATGAVYSATDSPQVETYLANVANEEEVVKLFDKIGKDFGELHGLVNNAGITRDALTLMYKEGQLVSKMSLEQCEGLPKN